jgi:hypothetical protein
MLMVWLLAAEQLHAPTKQLFGKSLADWQQSEVVSCPPVLVHRSAGLFVLASAGQSPVHMPSCPSAWHTQVVHALRTAVSPT